MVVWVKIGCGVVMDNIKSNEFKQELNNSLLCESPLIC